MTHSMGLVSARFGKYFMKLGKDEVSRCIRIFDPFLMIDGISEFIERDCAVGYKSVAENDWYMKSHLPEDLVMPATLQVEGMLQTMVTLIYKSFDHKGSSAFINKFDVSLLAPVKPGNFIQYYAKLTSFRRGICKGIIVGKVEERDVCHASVTYASPSLYSNTVFTK
jgi:3-hydroxyacyl-[acyl-carrier-protein] dehydratase